MKRLLLAALIAGVTACASALPLEWLLLTGGARDRLIDVLLREERLDELDFLMSVWEGDAWGAESAARTLIDTTRDPETTRWLAGYLRRTGRADEADRLDPPRPRSRALKAAAGLVTSAENLEGCVMAASASGANGYPVALSALLGLDPSDPASQVRFGGIGISDEAVELSLRAGDGPLPPDAPFALQGKAEVSDGWRDIADGVRLPGLWTVPLSSGRFFRAVFRW